MDAAEFVRICDNEFKFLESFGFDQREANADVLVWEVNYLSSSTIISPIYELRNQEIHIGIQPTAEVSGHAEDFNSWYLSFSLQDILVIRSPDIILSPRNFSPSARSLTDTEIKETLARSANALLEYGDDVLRGDFSLYGELKALYNGSG